eukprot:TRINITY_DN755_c0_g1_i2.p2 TRINITY_DN755_c0_g1~~TRINITY_DN755_c0_g1_i2.p2  ORF type:complete len:513 (-),score=153.55 TRINITY_DN755_c0_g1_i2:4865-6403(-)
MLWRLGFSTRPQVETAISKEGTTVQDVLNQDDVIQELKARNEKVIKYFSRPEVVEQLVQLIVEDPPEGAGEERIRKWPLQAAEVIRCEVEEVLDLVVQVKYLDEIFRTFLSKEGHSQLRLAVFEKTARALMTAKPNEVLDYFERLQADGSSIFDLLFRHIDKSPISDLVLHMATPSTYQDVNFVSLDMTSVPLETPGQQPETSPAEDVFVGYCVDEDLMERLFQLGLDKTGELIRSILDHNEKSEESAFVVYVVERVPSLLDLAFSIKNSSLFLTVFDILTEVKEFVRIDEECLGKFLVALKTPPPQMSLRTPAGEIRPPLGKWRLKVIEFLSDFSSVSMLTSGVFGEIVNLFFQYPNCSMLHLAVYQMIRMAIVSEDIPRETLYRYLFDDLKISEFLRIHFDENQSFICRVGLLLRQNIGPFEIISRDSKWLEFVRGPMQATFEKEMQNVGGPVPEHEIVNVQSLAGATAEEIDMEDEQLRILPELAEIERRAELAFLSSSGLDEMKKLEV